MSDIIDLETERKRYTEMDVRKRNPERFCLHPAVTVYEDTRTIECRECEATLDPVDVLHRMARNEMMLRHWEGEERKVRKRIADLERQEKNVKARVRKAADKLQVSQFRLRRELDELLKEAKKAARRYSPESVVDQVRSRILALFDEDAAPPAREGGDRG